MVLDAFKARLWKRSISVDSITRECLPLFKENCLFYSRDFQTDSRVTVSPFFLLRKYVGLNHWIIERASSFFPIRSFELHGDLGCGRLFEVQTRHSTKVGGKLGLVMLSICWRSSSASSLSSGAIPAVPAGGDFIWSGCLQATLFMTTARGSIEVQCLRPGCVPLTSNALNF